LAKGKGYDTRKHTLSCFGGAGGQHACAMARSLGIYKIIINRYAGILSAYGLSVADVVVEKQEACSLELNDSHMGSYVLNRIEFLKNECIEHLIKKENFVRDRIDTEVYLNLKYVDTDTGMMCSSKKAKANVFDLTVDDFRESFIEK
jgi:5-oxoprolinase (ATP-hydrolysing)